MTGKSVGNRRRDCRPRIVSTVGMNLDGMSEPRRQGRNTSTGKSLDNKILTTLVPGCISIIRLGKATASIYIRQSNSRAMARYN
jgi:hypothetical protein